MKIENILIVLSSFAIFGCNNTPTVPDATEELNKAIEIARTCGGVEELRQHMLAGLIILESKTEANIPYSESEAKTLATMRVMVETSTYEEKCGK